MIIWGTLPTPLATASLAVLSYKGCPVIMDVAECLLSRIEQHGASCVQLYDYNRQWSPPPAASTTRHCHRDSNGGEVGMIRTTSVRSVIYVVEP